MTNLTSYSEAIARMGEESRRRDEEAAENFKADFNTILASCLELDHDDLLDTYMEYHRPRSNIRLMMEHANLAEQLRKEIIRRMESC